MAEPLPPMKMQLPTWAKVLVGFFIFSIIGCVLTIGMAAIGFGTQFKKMTDPKEIAIVASQVFGITQLPEKFTYTAGARTPLFTFVTIEQNGHQTDFRLMQQDNIHKLTDPNLPQILQNDPWEGGVVLDKPTTGEMVISGHKMAYIVGDLGKQMKATQFRGAYLSSDNKYVNRVSAITAGTNFNMEATKQILSCIKQ